MRYAPPSLKHSPTQHSPCHALLNPRACRIKNTPLPAKYTTLEEDLLPMLPEGGAGMGMVQIQVRLGFAPAVAYRMLGIM